MRLSIYKLRDFRRFGPGQILSGARCYGTLGPLAGKPREAMRAGGAVRRSGNRLQSQSPESFPPNQLPAGRSAT